jgi:hypothetical protein
MSKMKSKNRYEKKPFYKTGECVPAEINATKSPIGQSAISGGHVEVASSASERFLRPPLQLFAYMHIGRHFPRSFLLSAFGSLHLSRTQFYLPNTIFTTLHIFVRFSTNMWKNSDKFVKNESYQFSNEYVYA